MKVSTRFQQLSSDKIFDSNPSEMKDWEIHHVQNYNQLGWLMKVKGM